MGARSEVSASGVVAPAASGRSRAGGEGAPPMKLATWCIHPPPLPPAGPTPPSDSRETPIAAATQLSILSSRRSDSAAFSCSCASAFEMVVIWRRTISVIPRLWSTSSAIWLPRMSNLSGRSTALATVQPCREPEAAASSVLSTAERLIDVCPRSRGLAPPCWMSFASWMISRRSAIQMAACRIACAVSGWRLLNAISSSRDW